MQGRISGDSRTQCTAGAGTLLLEFGLLSRLTGDQTYHTAALQALRSLWSRRSPIGLLGNTIDNLSAQVIPWKDEVQG